MRKSTSRAVRDFHRRRAALTTGTGRDRHRGPTHGFMLGVSPARPCRREGYLASGKAVAVDQKLRPVLVSPMLPTGGSFGQGTRRCVMWLPWGSRGRARVLDAALSALWGEAGGGADFLLVGFALVRVLFLSAKHLFYSAARHATPLLRPKNDGSLVMRTPIWGLTSRRSAPPL